MNYDVEIEGATVSYRDHLALKNVSLKIERGSFLMVVGPNGAGKTTLLTLINGLGKRSGGGLKLFGRSIRGVRLGRLRQEIGYVPQGVTIDPRMPISVEEVVMLGRAGKIGMLRSPNADDFRIMNDVCELVGISGLRKKPIGCLSGGEQKKVSLARALAQEPRLLMLDEPIANLDPRAQNDILKLIEDIYLDKKITVIFVTHILSHIPEVCSHAVFVKEGRLVDQGPFRKLFTLPGLEALYDFPVKPEYYNHNMRHD